MGGYLQYGTTVYSYNIKERYLTILNQPGQALMSPK